MGPWDEAVSRTPAAQRRSPRRGDSRSPSAPAPASSQTPAPAPPTPSLPLRRRRSSSPPEPLAGELPPASAAAKLAPARRRIAGPGRGEWWRGGVASPLRLGSGLAASASASAPAAPTHATRTAAKFQNPPCLALAHLYIPRCAAAGEKNGLKKI